MNLITKQKFFMNTTITIKVVQDNESSIEIFNKIEDAYDEFDRIVKKYTRFNENSELSNLNRNSGEWVKVSDEFITLIKYMLDLANKTDGVFDPTIIDLLEMYGYDKNYDFSKLENPDLENNIKTYMKTRPSFREIQLDEKQNKVKLFNGQKIDLGGIGKGYAIDCAYERLSKLSNFLIDAGGDIRVKGRNETVNLWRCALKDHDENGEKIIGYVELDNESLAASGSWARKVKNFHHLINPYTGKPENTYRTVYVQSVKAIDADSWATAIFVGGEKIKTAIPEWIKYTAIKS